MSNLFNIEAMVGGTKKEITEKIIATLKANGQTQTKSKKLIEVAVPTQINAMLREVGKKGRWKGFKQVGKDDQIRLEKIAA